MPIQKQDGTDRVVIHQSKKKQGKLVLYGILLLAGCVVTLRVETWDNEVERIKNMSVGFWGLLFFGAAFLWIVKQFLFPKDVLVMNKDGFWDYSSAVSLGFVPWQDVEEMEIVPFIHGQQFISVSLKETHSVTIPKWKEWLHEINAQRYGLPAVNITLQSADAEYEDVLRMMKHYYRAYCARQD